MKTLLIYIFGVSVIMAIEKPDYKVIQNYGNVEIREYKPMVIAKTNVHQSFGEALNEGFRRIANYIFGGNEKKMSIAMTAPVISQKLSTDFEEYEVLFVMPREYTMSMFWLKGLLLSVFLAIVGQLSDLVESKIKRLCNVKDSGTLLPGHGGILDRIDGYLLTAPVFYYFLKI